MTRHLGKLSLFLLSLTLASSAICILPFFQDAAIGVQMAHTFSDGGEMIEDVPDLSYERAPERMVFSLYRWYEHRELDVEQAASFLVHERKTWKFYRELSLQPKGMDAEAYAVTYPTSFGFAFCHEEVSVSSHMSYEFYAMIVPPWFAVSAPAAADPDKGDPDKGSKGVFSSPG